MLPNSVSYCRAKPFKVSAAAPRPRKKGHTVFLRLFYIFCLLGTAYCVLRTENIFVCCCWVQRRFTAYCGCSYTAYLYAKISSCWCCDCVGSLPALAEIERTRTFNKLGPRKGPSALQSKHSLGQAPRLSQAPHTPRCRREPATSRSPCAHLAPSHSVASRRQLTVTSPELQ